MTEGHWNEVVEMNPEQRVEMCKDAYRREHAIEDTKMYEATVEFRTMKVRLFNVGQLRPVLLKCVIHSSTRWNGAILPEHEVLYLAEGNSSTEVFKLQALSHDKVRLVGKISPVTYRH